MAAESIITYLKPNYPQKGVTANAYQTDLIYIGPYSTLLSASPAVGALWGDYIGKVDTARIEPISGTNPLQGELTVTVTRDFEADGGGSTAGVDGEITYELEWTVVSRPLLEHPEFRTGTYALTATDGEEIATWQNAKTSTNRTALSAAAEKYAKAVDLGIDTYDDYAPILSKTTTYTNGPPSSSSAGEKDSNALTGFPNGPSGYEWIKSADRAVKAGKKNKWDRTEQWLGAKKIMVDKNSLYY
jgi:hypothetical protein